MKRNSAVNKNSFLRSCLFSLCLSSPIILLYYTLALGAMQGVCSDCHTMHNSQNGSAMNYDGSTTANIGLTRATCYGCHAQGGTSPTVTIGSTIVPQVMHSSTEHLAGGNFGYITGMAGSGAADNKGHNIKGLTGTDDTLFAPPGGIKLFGHDDGLVVNTDNLSCSGNRGCHGYRTSDSGDSGMSGSHHKNAGGKLDNPTEPANSYRFLMGVKGFESPDWEENPTAQNHNEYFGLATPIQLGCSAVSCHQSTGVQPPDGTMSQFCATCHGNFHTLTSISSSGVVSEGVGATASSPFIRHPTDLSLPATGEYAAYTEYNLGSPVARLTVPETSGSAVTPGSDAVMCLSCHVPHASDYPDMLRWDYSTMIAGNGGAASGTGCFVCHTTKD